MISEEAITARLIADEGEVLHCYLDSLGFQTIGVGRLVDQRKGGGSTTVHWSTRLEIESIAA